MLDSIYALGILNLICHIVCGLKVQRKEGIACRPVEVRMKALCTEQIAGCAEESNKYHQLMPFTLLARERGLHPTPAAIV